MKRVLRYILLLLLFPATLGLQYLLQNDPKTTESVYSRGIYPVLSGILGPVFGIVPVSVAEVLAVLFILLLLRAVIRGIAHLRANGFFSVFRGLLWLAACASVGYFLFYSLWGFNYYRLPIEQNLSYRTGTPTKEELSGLLSSEISAVNALCPEITYGKDGVSTYAGGFYSMKNQVNQGYGRLTASQSPTAALFGRTSAAPKAVLGSQFMSYTGIEGIFVPFTYEPSINTDYPAFILPFTIAHETAHFKGIAREDEANFVAYLADCSNPDVYYQYSAHMNAVMYLSNALYATDQTLWKQTVAPLDSRAKADFSAYTVYVSRHQGKLEQLATSVNDTYLKSNGQSGVVSYDHFVDLLCDKYRTETGK